MSERATNRSPGRGDRQRQWYLIQTLDRKNSAGANQQASKQAANKHLPPSTGKPQTCTHSIMRFHLSATTFKTAHAEMARRAATSWQQPHAATRASAHPCVRPAGRPRTRFTTTGQLTRTTASQNPTANQSMTRIRHFKVTFCQVY